MKLHLWPPKTAKHFHCFWYHLSTKTKTITVSQKLEQWIVQLKYPYY